MTADSYKKSKTDMRVSCFLFAYYIANIIKRNWLFYVIGAIVVLLVKYFYTNAGSAELEWILSPTAWWTGFLSGIPFEKEAQMGYVNHLYKVIIAPSCSSVRFMIVTLATLLYSFVHRMRTMRTGFLWLALSLAFSYLYTVFVNGIRITVSIFIRMSDDIGWLTPEKFHTLEGIAVYFIALIAAFQIAGHVSLWLSGQMVSRCATLKQFLLCRCVPPAFWYFAFTLGIPLVRGAYSGNPGSFIAYTTLMLFAFMAIVFLLSLVFVFRKRIKS